MIPLLALLQAPTIVVEAITATVLEDTRSVQLPTDHGGIIRQNDMYDGLSLISSSRRGAQRRTQNNGKNTQMKPILRGTIVNRTK